MLRWCSANAAYLQSPPHPSPLPYHLHRSVFLRIASPTEALAYARVHLMPYLPSQPVLQLITSCLYRPGSSPYMHDTSPLVVMFRAEYCRRHGLAKDEPLEVVVDLGSRGGALNVIEKARRVMGDRLGNVRSWQELPVSGNTRGLNRSVPDDTDGSPPAAIEAVSLRLCLSRLKGTGNRREPTEDAHMRPRHRPGEFHQAAQGREAFRKVPVLPHGDVPAGGTEVVFLVTVVTPGRPPA